jgi:hypothetical protein
MIVEFSVGFYGGSGVGAADGREPRRHAPLGAEDPNSSLAATGAASSCTRSSAKWPPRAAGTRRVRSASLTVSG